MRRILPLLQDRLFDVIVVGGGVQGASVARDAALRGLSVALVEQGDFCSATSHNSLKTIHGGIRYLQHLNFKRAIESIREQQILMKTAPHLVQPLPFLMPTYGFGMRGPVAVGIGIGLFEILNGIVSLRDSGSLDWPKGRLMGPSSCKKLAPGIDDVSLTGGAIWADAQVAFADKAVLQFLQQAVDHDACVANYVRAEKLLFDVNNPSSVCGIRAKDMHTGDGLEIRAHSVVNATGPWATNWIERAGHPKLSLKVSLVKSMNLVTTKVAPKHAIAVKSNRASDSRIDKANRLFFIVPWQGKAVIGTTHFTYRPGTSEAPIDPDEIAAFVEEFRSAYPAMGLTPDDILYCYQGLTPGDESSMEDGAKKHESEIVDHALSDGVSGILSIICIKWTTARLVAEQTVDRLLLQRNERRDCLTRRTALPDYPNMPHDTSNFSDEQLRDFVATHVDHTQARRLDDIVLRRTNDLVLGNMSAETFALITKAMAERFFWSAEERQEEVRRVLDRLANLAYRRSLVDGLAEMVS